MRRLARAILPAAGLLAVTGNLTADEGIEFFEKKIRPVLIEHCYKCHSAEAEEKGKLKGKLRLDLREAIRGRGESGLLSVVPGKPDESNLYRAIAYLDPELVMPPKTRLAKGVVADGALTPEGLKQIRSLLLESTVFYETKMPEVREVSPRRASRTHR